MSDLDKQSDGGDFHVLPEENGSFALVVPTEVPECGVSSDLRMSAGEKDFSRGLDQHGLKFLSFTHRDGQIRLQLRWLPDGRAQNIERVAKWVFAFVKRRYEANGAPRRIEINQGRDLSEARVNWENVVSGLVAQVQKEGTRVIKIDGLSVDAQRGQIRASLKFKGCWNWREVDAVVASIRDELSEMAATAEQRILEQTRQREAKAIRDAKGAMIRVFISHSSADSGVAAALIDLLRAALNLSASDIRCTSVDGYRLPGGISTDDQLRMEVPKADVFIALVSQHSMASTYVDFELGARWGVGRRLIPLLTPGTAASILRGPLQGINALSCNSASQLHQLVSEIGQALGIKPDTVAAYEDKIERVRRTKDQE